MAAKIVLGSDVENEIDTEVNVYGGTNITVENTTDGIKISAADAANMYKGMIFMPVLDRGMEYIAASNEIVPKSDLMDMKNIIDIYESILSTTKGKVAGAKDAVKGVTLKHLDSYKYANVFNPHVLEDILFALNYTFCKSSR